MPPWLVGNIRVAAIFAGMVAFLIVFLPIQFVALVLARFGILWPSGIIPLLFHRWVLKISGIRLKVDGRFVQHRPLLIASNHVSWLDIVVLGAVAKLSFIAKSEVLSWPVFGKLAQLQRTVFIKRERRRDSSNQADTIAQRLSQKEIMVLFPEGTTTDGNQLDPFKTALFEAARIALVASDLKQALVQPIAIRYSRLHGLPIGRAERPHVAWPGEIGLGESLIPLLRTGALDVTVHIGEAIPFDEHSNRKQISAKAHQSIRSMLTGKSRSTLIDAEDKEPLTTKLATAIE